MGTLFEEFHKELYRRQEEQAELPTGSTLNIPNTFEPDKEITQKAFQTLYGEKRWICANDKLYCRHHLHYEHSPEAVEIRR